MTESYDAGSVVVTTQHAGVQTIQGYRVGAHVIRSYEAGSFVVPQAPGPWTPSEILADLYAWYDPSDDANLALTGSEVNGATDLSGNARHLGVDGTGSITNAGSINGVQGIRAVGNAKHLFRTDAWSPAAYMFVQSTSDTLYMTLSGNLTGKYQLLVQSGSAAANIAGSTQTAVRVDGTAVAVPATRGTMYTSINGTHVGYSEATLTSWTAIRLFGYYSGTTFSYSGDFGEFIFLNAIPTTDTRQKLEGYMAHKWGTTASLDGAHPYKSTAPTV
jgi:hypothetical protein